MPEMTEEDLPARMRTCSAFIRNTLIDGPMPTQHLLEDVALLLEQGADKIDRLEPPKPEDLGPLMEIIKPLPAQPIQKPLPEMAAVFVDPGVPDAPNAPSARTCPQCDSRANKTVRRVGDWLELECPVCGTRWNYRSKGKAKWI